MHLQTGLCVGGGKPPFRINRGILEFKNSNCEILSRRALDTYLNDIITSIVVPSYIKEIGNCAFACNYDLKIVKYMSKAPIPKRAFYNCGSLSDIYIYGNVKEISPLAFTKVANWDGEYDEHRNYSITIHAKKDSYAHIYAKKYNFKFKELSNYYFLKNFDNHYYEKWRGRSIKKQREKTNKYLLKEINKIINKEKFKCRLARDQSFQEYDLYLKNVPKKGRK